MKITQVFIDGVRTEDFSVIENTVQLNKGALPKGFTVTVEYELEGVINRDDFKTNGTVNLFIVGAIEKIKIDVPLNAYLAAIEAPYRQRTCEGMKKRHVVLTAPIPASEFFWWLETANGVTVEKGA